ncbi:MAG TPA: hypothetical protein VHE30_03810 [Polyangiaceae bacterium]|nr:hypothetical protein [Polyangiaceae bacterium]
MRAFAVPALVVSLLTSSTAALAAPSSKTDVKVCVRIEEKSWARDGSTAPVVASPAPSVAPAAEPSETPPKGASPPARAASAATPAPAAPPNSVPIPAEPPQNLARFGEAPPAVAVEPSPGISPQELVKSDEADPFVIDPKLYLKRLLEYEVTHEPGFESVDAGCAQTLTVELYPVRHGWTVFARYSGNAREEKVDVVRLDELDTFATRVATALLRDRSIAETLTRTTVLRADSETDVRRIATRPHLLLAMGSATRVGRLPTAPNDVDPAKDALRVETPLSFSVGARNKFRAWALDATGRLDVGLVQLAPRRNPGGGHADFSVGFGFGLGFLAYADPDAVNTLYYGGGGSFEVVRYQTLGPKTEDGLATPGGLWGGGLNVDAILGYEFMRTSALHFFVQGKLSAPAYVFDSENDQTRIKSYIPNLDVQVGLLF